MLSTHALYSFNVEVPSKIALLAGADSPSKFLWFKIDLPLTSYFFYFFHFFLTFPLSAPPSTGGSFSFFFPGRLSAFLFFCLFLLFSFISNAFLASFLFSFENQERRKKDFSASFPVLFSSVWKEREKKSREGQGLCPVPSAFERRKRVRSVLVGMMEMMLFGWEQNNQE